MQIGERLQEIRRDSNLTQKEFADLLHVTRQTVSNWELEKSYLDLESLILISDHFNVSLDNLIKGDRKMTSEIDRRIKWSKELKAVPLMIGLCVWEFLMFEIFVDISLGLLISAITLAILGFIGSVIVLRIERTVLTILSGIICFAGMTVILLLFAVMWIMGMGE